MTHLTVEEIIDFVSINVLTPENIPLTQKVNGHIRTCKECLEKVRAFQDIHDEMMRIANSGGIRKNMYQIVAEDEKLSRMYTKEELEMFEAVNEKYEMKQQN